MNSKILRQNENVIGNFGHYLVYTQNGNYVATNCAITSTQLALKYFTGEDVQQTIIPSWISLATFADNHTMSMVRRGVIYSFLCVSPVNMVLVTNSKRLYQDCIKNFADYESKSYEDDVFTTFCSKLVERGFYVCKK